MRDDATSASLRERTAARGFAIGACLGLAGIALVEALILAGLRPASPISWPSIGMLGGAALGGMAGFVGGAVTFAGYYAVNALHPERFAPFFAHPFVALSLLAGLVAVAAAILVLRARLLRALHAEAELEARRAYEKATRESDERLRIIADNAPALIAYVDRDERYRFNNRAYEEWLGVPVSEMTGRSMRELWGEERYSRVEPHIRRALQGERVYFDYTMAQNGVERHILAHYVPDFDAEGRVKGFFLLGTDVTQLEAVRRELAAARQRLESALDGSSVALWDTDLRTGRVYLSDAWADIVGGPREDTVATTHELIALLHPDDVGALKRVSVEVMKGTRGIYAIEHRVRARDGQWRWILSRGRVTERDESGRALRMIGTNVDITDRKRIEEAMQSAAQTDALTGVANRLLFTDRLRLALARRKRSGAQLAVLFLDIDRFKGVNDDFGHAAGDALLVALAERLRACVRATDTIARLGGDEFVVLLEDLHGRDNAERVAQKIVEEVRRPLLLAGREATVTTSIGIAFADDTTGEEELLKRADAALYAAKNAGRNAYRVAA